MKGRIWKIGFVTIILVFFSIGIFSQIVFCDDDEPYASCEKLISANGYHSYAGGMIIENYDGHYYNYNISYHVWFDIGDDPEPLEQGKISVGWVAGSSLFSYFYEVEIPSTKIGSIEFESEYQISTFFVATEEGAATWSTVDWRNGACIFFVENIHDFEYTHFLYTENALYSIKYDVLWPNLAISESFFTWDFQKVANLSTPDTLFDKLNFTAVLGYRLGTWSGETRVMSNTLIKTNNTELPLNGTLINEEDYTTTENNIFETIYYSLECTNGISTGLLTPPMDFFPAGYYDEVPSNWSLLSNWTKYGIIAGNLALLGFIGYIINSIVAKFKSLKRKT
jgi:hypothetical protein